jgi:transcriptional regulator with XRE-family HTH domain
MKINSALVLEQRLMRSLSQDELAIMSGLNIRTIQRIENEGIASLQTKKSLAVLWKSMSATWTMRNRAQ